ncbi:acyltransferase family protein [Bacteroides sedimenti]|uniref:acyltransferase family protein n=1 Tax=Bacteroides sedimenti TaxID=2136147 RepID=UPI003341C5C7
MKQRIEYIDLAKGFCILLVILHHIEGPFEQTDINRLLMPFRMPLYYFLSGFFFHRYAGFVNFTLRKINKLLVPCFFFLFITYLFYSGIWLINGQYDSIFQIPKNLLLSLSKDSIYLNTPLWFFVSLFEVSVIFYIITVISERLSIKFGGKKALMAIFCFSSGILGYEMGIYKIGLPFWLDTSITSIPFYYIGYFLIKETDFLSSNKLDKYIPIILVALGLIVYILADFSNNRTNVYHGNFIPFYLSAFSGTFFVLLLSKLIKKLPIVSVLGQYSGIVLGTHFTLILLLKKYLFFVNNDWLLTGIIFLIISVVSVPVCRFFLRYFPKFIGQKDLINTESQLSAKVFLICSMLIFLMFVTS